MKKCNWIWLDLETTGLDPRAPGARILEVAATLAHDSAEGDMTPFSDFAVNDPVKTTRDQFAAAWAGMSTTDANFVRDMHTYNGLIGACINATRTIEQFDDALVDLARALTCAKRPKDVVIAGDSVHFDLEWIRVHLPKFAACLSHRVYNVSTLKACARTWGAWPERLKKDDAHRAMADVLASLEAAKIFKVDYRARLKLHGPEVPFIHAIDPGIQKGSFVCLGTDGVLRPAKAAPSPADHCTFPTDGSAKGRGVYEHEGVLYLAPDPGPDHELISADEAKRDPRAQYQVWYKATKGWDGWTNINFCQHYQDVLYAFRRPKAKWVACTRTEAHAFGGQARSPGMAWVDFDHKVYPPGGDVVYRVDATRTNELSPVVVLAPDIFRAIPPIKGFALSLAGGRYAIERTLIPVGTYLG